eukprot:364569-Chlamydomonas_euryale.AAC.9
MDLQTRVLTASQQQTTAVAARAAAFAGHLLAWAGCRLRIPCSGRASDTLQVTKMLPDRGVGSGRLELDS